MGLIVFRALQDFTERTEEPADNLLWARDDELTDRGSADDQEFERLPQHVQMAAQRHITGDDATENDNETNDEKH